MHTSFFKIKMGLIKLQGLTISSKFPNCIPSSESRVNRKALPFKAKLAAVYA
jgi:hypothetical protein